MRQSISITGCPLVGWSVARSVGRSGNAFVRRSTRRTLLAYLALFFALLLPPHLTLKFQSQDNKAQQAKDASRLGLYSLSYTVLVYMVVFHYGLTVQGLAV